MEFFTKYPLVSNQIDRRELKVILRELYAVLAKNIRGDIAEFGCYEGTTALFLQRMCQAYGQDKTLYVYDSFAGLPAKSREDASPAGTHFTAGQLSATKTQLVRHFKQAGLPLPVIRKGWFADIQPHEVPATICFAFLDGDFYQSIIDSLRLVWPRLTPGAVVIVDDYGREALPGVKKALDQWAVSHRFALRVEASLAILRPI